MTAPHRISPVFSRCLAALAFIAILPAGLSAQETQRVAAVVNDEIVSMHDLDQRMKVAVLSSNLPDTTEVRTRLLPQVLRRLIDERLELQEAQRLKISISPNEIANGIGTIEQRNNMTHGSFEPLLKSKGIDPETMRQQVRAELSWVQVVRHELRSELHVSEESVEGRLASLHNSMGKPEFLAAEIYLPVDGPSHDDEMRNLGERLIDQMRQGAPFSALALQFSQTGAAGGDLGWVSEGMLDDALMRALAQMQPGSITPPIRTIDGYHILLLRDKRLIGQGLTSGPTIDVLSVELASLPSATEAERGEQLKHLRDTLAAGKNCDDFERVVKEVPSAVAARNNDVPVAQIPPEVARLISQASPGTVSEPLEGPNFRRMFAVCGRHDANGGLPSREEIRRRMEDEQLEIMARRYLRDLRRSAFIEIRN